MKQKKFFLIILLFAILFVYITNINTIPKNIVLLEGEQYNFSFLKGFNIEGNNVTVGETFWNKLATIKSNLAGDSKLELKTFGIKVKDIAVSVIPDTSVVPCGDPIGVKIYSEGILVVGKSPVESVNSESYEPYNKSKIEVGDTILKINNEDVDSILDLVTAVNANLGSMVEVEYRKRDNNVTYKDKIEPVKSLDDGKYKLGLWVRDGAMGVGTLTFYIPETKTYGALGHGISDVDVKEILSIEKGILNGASIISVSKGRKSFPGELRGILNSDVILGEVSTNTKYGIYGKYDGSQILFKGRKEIEVASRNEIKIGSAKIICTVEGNVPKEYNIEIEKIYNSVSDTTKSMIIKVVDDYLIEKTGGIVQGMSGSPIIQNGKFIGAITHVFVNDPTRGFAIFGDIMIKEARR